MANPYFEFKKFTVHHDRCAMKVGTDGVLLGAWCNIADADTALDIGTGTGLIAMMMAQRNENITIDAIDIDTNAIEQAKENIEQSPYGKQIQCYHSSLQSFDKLSQRKYDIIVSNPPFFVQSLKSPDECRTLARHTDSLSVEELISTASDFLSDKGRLNIIYPFEYKDFIEQQAIRNGLHISRITNVYSTPTASAKRVLIELSKQDIPLIEDNLIIEKERHIYTEEFTELAKDFYLKL